MPSTPGPKEMPGPKLAKGVLIAYDMESKKPTPTVIAFQYNPDSLSRSFTQRSTPREGEDGRKPKQKAPTVSTLPLETISLQVEIDATDLMETNDARTNNLGIYPTISALEMLMTPDLKRVNKQKEQAEAGTVGVEPNQLPLVLFVWGQSRVMPVKVTNLSFHETDFDAQLNPIRAEVGMSLAVLTYEELEKDSIGHKAALALQRRREQMATERAMHPPSYYGYKEPT